jgi:hypothetical protein
LKASENSRSNFSVLGARFVFSFRFGSEFVVQVREFREVREFGSSGKFGSSWAQGAVLAVYSNPDRRTRNLEPGTSNVEPGTSNVEPGTSNPELRSEHEHEPSTENREARTTDALGRCRTSPSHKRTWRVPPGWATSYQPPRNKTLTFTEAPGIGFELMPATSEQR